MKKINVEGRAIMFSEAERIIGEYLDNSGKVVQSMVIYIDRNMYSILLTVYDKKYVPAWGMDSLLESYSSKENGYCFLLINAIPLNDLERFINNKESGGWKFKKEMVATF